MSLQLLGLRTNRKPPFAGAGFMETELHKSNAEGGQGRMLWYTWVFLVIAIIAAILGFGGIAAAAATVAKICFVVFIILFLVSILAGRRRTI
jgi:uncharacterized membrane protein YtjA (UPF0391 family)